MTMPANVETMFSAGQTPWHRLGVVTDNPLDSADAIGQAGLDWTVSLRPLFTFDRENETEGNIIDVPNTFATVRDSDDTVLGVVGNRYTPIQNVECFNFLDTVLDDYEARYETAGALDNGRIVWMLLNLGKDIVVGDDITVPYLLLTNSHDGSTAIKAMTTPIRVVCQNTLTLALNNYASQFSFRHTQNVHGRIDQARNALELSYKYVDGFQEEVERLIEQEVTDQRFQELTEILFPVPELLDDASNAVVYQKAKETSENVIANFRTPEFEEHANSAWSAINAVSNYELWSAPIRGSERDVRIMQRTIQQTQTPKTNQLHRMLISDRY
jgi:phage/plasmid-like protein (TIGR03299 family)